jgi:hypothetical protein
MDNRPLLRKADPQELKNFSNRYLPLLQEIAQALSLELGPGSIMNVLSDRIYVYYSGSQSASFCFHFEYDIVEGEISIVLKIDFHTTRAGWGYSGTVALEMLDIVFRAKGLSEEDIQAHADNAIRNKLIEVLTKVEQYSVRYGI